MSSIQYFEIDENGEYHKVEPPKPSKNLVVVVRCKDCKHWHRGECGSRGTCESENMNVCGFTDAEWFCADGRKRDENT